MGIGFSGDEIESGLYLTGDNMNKLSHENKFWLRCPKCNKGGIIIKEKEDQSIYSYCTYCFVILTPEHIERLIEEGITIEQNDVVWPNYKSFDEDLQPTFPKIWGDGKWVFDWGEKFKLMGERHMWKEGV